MANSVPVPRVNFTIISSAPNNGAAGVLLDSFFEIVTSVQLRPQSVNSTSIVISDTGNNRLEGSFSYSNHTNGTYGIIGFSPSEPLKALMTYTITITTILGTFDEILSEPAVISFTAGEILTRTLTTTDNISFFERICYPQDGQNILAFSQYNGNDQIESRYLEKKIAPQRYPVVSQVVGEGGTITPAGTFSQIVGSSKSFTTEAGVGYRLARLYIDGYPSVAARIQQGWGFTNILKSHHITAQFLPPAYLTTEGSLDSVVTWHIPQASLKKDWKWTAKLESAFPEEIDAWYVFWDGDPSKFSWKIDEKDGTIIHMEFLEQIIQTQHIDIQAYCNGTSYLSTIHLDMDGYGYYYYGYSAPQQSAVWYNGNLEVPVAGQALMTDGAMVWFDRYASETQTLPAGLLSPAGDYFGFYNANGHVVKVPVGSPTNYQAWYVRHTP